ncbi:LOG family protein [Pseudomonas sp. SDO528_S397]
MPCTLRSLAVFCGTNAGFNPLYAEAAQALGREMARRGIRLVYGGTHKGLMGVLADAVMAEGGDVIGVITHLIQRRGHQHEGLAQCEVTQDMRTRKARMSELADGFIALPGGLGTFEELLEVATLTQLGEHHKGVACLNTCGFFEPLRALLDHAVNEGFLKVEHHQMLILQHDPGALLDALEQWQAPVVSKLIAPVPAR